MISRGEKLKRARVAQRPVPSQREAAEMFGTTRERWSSYEINRAQPPEDLIDKVALTWEIPGDWFRDGEDTWPPTVRNLGVAQFPVNAVLAPVPLGRAIPAGDWEDSDEEDNEQFVELDPKFAGKGRKAYPILGDSMYPLLHPKDLAVYQFEPESPIGLVVFARSGPQVTTKQLTHNGRDYVLHPLNPRYEDLTANDWCVRGYLVGIVGEREGCQFTLYNPNGIRPAHSSAVSII
jgi:SOS-response transcriptional repressor LexA